MKLNWGSGIAIFYTAFVLVMIFMVYKSTTYDHSLVVDNYYEKDLNYPAHLEKIKNARALEKDLQVSKDSTGTFIRFMFPAELQKPTGEILFYRASDSSKDLKVPIMVDESNNMNIRHEMFDAGQWTIKVEWQAEGTAYYKEQQITM